MFCFACKFSGMTPLIDGKMINGFHAIDKWIITVDNVNVVRTIWAIVLISFSGRAINLSLCNRHGERIQKSVRIYNERHPNERLSEMVHFYISVDIVSKPYIANADPRSIPNQWTKMSKWQFTKPIINCWACGRKNVLNDLAERWAYVLFLKILCMMLARWWPSACE